MECYDRLDKTQSK